MLSQLNKLDRDVPLLFVGAAVIVASFTTGLAAISYQPPIACPNTAEVIKYFPADKPVERISPVASWPSVEDRFWSFAEDVEPVSNPIVVSGEDETPQLEKHRRWRRHWWRRR